MRFSVKNMCCLLPSVLMAFGSLSMADDLVAVQVNGNIVASPCLVSGNGVIPVDLGQNINASDLAAPGAASPWVAFDITVDTCPTGTTQATITFHGTPDAANPNDMYENTGDARNLAVQVQGTGGEQFGNGKTNTGTITNNTYTWHLRARAYTQSGSVTPGTINAAITATFVYQ